MLIRENYLSKIRGFYDSNLIKILVGIRRCGKSVILNQIIEELKEKRNVDEEHIIFINFEFIEYEDLLEYKKLNKYIKDNKIYYLFLDEIQNVDEFEKVINSLRASIKNISIFITGSNSKVLSDELSTVLSGMYVLFNINPLSYKEYIDLTGRNGYDISGKSILKTLNKYYVTDLGIAQIKNNNPEFKSYIVLENIVYNELINRNYEVYIGKTKNGEVDFLAKKDGKIKYIQVTYEMNEKSEMIEREFGAYKFIDDNYPKYVISLDKIDLSRNGIIHLNLIDFLLNDELI